MAKLPDHVGIDFGTHSVKAVELRGIHTTTPQLVKSR
jgi:Tfp pilus assembly PilM family ATPase